MNRKHITGILLLIITLTSGPLFYPLTKASTTTQELTSVETPETQYYDIGLHETDTKLIINNGLHVIEFNKKSNQETLLNASGLVDVQNQEITLQTNQESPNYQPIETSHKLTSKQIDPETWAITRSHTSPIADYTITYDIQPYQPIKWTATITPHTTTNLRLQWKLTDIQWINPTTKTSTIELTSDKRPGNLVIDYSDVAQSKGDITTTSITEKTSTTDLELNFNIGTTTKDTTITLDPLVGYANNVALIVPRQQKTVYAQNRHWTIYPEPTSPYDVLIHTSTNTIDWTTIDTGKDFYRGRSLSWTYDESTNHIHILLGTESRYTYYRMGTLHANGTITWAAPWQTAYDDGATGSDYYYRPIIFLDKDGYPWVHGRYYNGNGVSKILSSTTKNGTWTQRSGFPYTIENTPYTRFGDGAGLPNGDVFFQWTLQDYSGIRYVFWNRTSESFGTPATISTGTLTTADESSSICDESGQIWIAYSLASGSICTQHFTPNRTLCDPETIITQSGHPVLTNVENDILLFYHSNGIKYYRRWEINKTWTGSYDLLVNITSANAERAWSISREPVENRVSGVICGSDTYPVYYDYMNITQSDSHLTGEAPFYHNYTGYAWDLPDEDILSYEWDFDGDGVIDYVDDETPDTTHILHTDTETTTYRAEFTAINLNGTKYTKNVTITVNPANMTHNWYQIKDTGGSVYGLHRNGTIFIMDNSDRIPLNYQYNGKTLRNPTYVNLNNTGAVLTYDANTTMLNVSIRYGVQGESYLNFTEYTTAKDGLPKSTGFSYPNNTRNKYLYFNHTLDDGGAKDSSSTSYAEAGSYDPWKGGGLVPYGQYFANNNEYMSPESASLTVIATDISIPGRGIDLIIKRVHIPPSVLRNKNDKPPVEHSFYTAYPWAKLGNGWSLGLPWVEFKDNIPKYIHLSNGQKYKYKVPTTDGVKQRTGDKYILYKVDSDKFNLVLSSGVTYCFGSKTEKYPLNSIIDKNGNKITLTNNDDDQISQIVDTMGRKYNFSYSLDGYLADISYGASCVEYTHSDGLNNKVLSKVTDELERETEYKYRDNNYHISQVKYPTGGYTNYTYKKYAEDKKYLLRVETVEKFDESGSTLSLVEYEHKKRTGSASFLKYDTTIMSEYNSDNQVMKKVKYYSTTKQKYITTSIKDGASFSETSEEFSCYEKSRKQTPILSRLSLGNQDYEQKQKCDKWGNVVYKKDYNGKVRFYSYSNTNSENKFVNYQGSEVDFFSNSFYPNQISKNMTSVLLGTASFINDLHSNVTETYFRYDEKGQLTKSKTLFDGEWIESSNVYDDYGNLITSNNELGQPVFVDYNSTYKSAYLTSISIPYSNPGQRTRWNDTFESGDLSKWSTTESASCSVTCTNTTSLSGNYSAISAVISGGYAYLEKSFAKQDTVSTRFLFKLDSVPQDTQSITIYELQDENNNVITSLSLETQTGLYFKHTGMGSTTSVSVSVKAGEWHSVEVFCNRSDTLGTILVKLDGSTKIHLENIDTQNGAYEYDKIRVGILSSGYNATLNVEDVYLYERSIQTQFTHDNDLGEITRIIDATGNCIDYEYDILGRITRVDNPVTSGPRTNKTAVYNDTANTVTLYDELNHKMVKSFDDLARLTKVERYMGDSVYSSVQTTYNYQGLVNNTTTADGTVYSFVYDGLGRTKKEVNPDDSFKRYTYSRDGLTTTVFDEEDRKRELLYDVMGNLVEVKEYNSSTTFYRTEYGYDVHGNLVSLVDGLGRETVFGYDQLGRLVRSDYPDGSSESFGYDELSRVVWSVDRSGQQTINYYDCLGNLLNTTIFNEVGWQNGWNYRQELTFDNGHGGALDAYSVPIRVHYGTDLSPQSTEVYLDEHSRPDFGDLRFTTKDGAELDYWVQYQEDGDYADLWLKLNSVASNGSKVYVYYGNKDASSTSNGEQVWDSYYDFENSLERWTVRKDGSTGAVTSVDEVSYRGSYSDLSNQPNTGSPSHIHFYSPELELDDTWRVLWALQVDDKINTGSAERLTVSLQDAGGDPEKTFFRVNSVKDESHVAVYQSGWVNVNATVEDQWRSYMTYGDSTVGSWNLTLGANSVYDGLMFGPYTWEDNGSGSDFDTLELLIDNYRGYLDTVCVGPWVEDEPELTSIGSEEVGSGVGGSTVTYTYDDLGRVVSNNNSFTSMEYCYDSLGRVLSEKYTIDGEPYDVDYQYDACGNVVELVYPDTSMVEYVYDDLNRITSITGYADISYLVDDVISQIQFENGVNTSYSYDSRNRPTRVKTNNSVCDLLVLDYAYDDTGSVTSIDNGTDVEYFSYDLLDRIVWANGSWGDISYAYDPVGNRVSKTLDDVSTTAYTYDSMDQMLTATGMGFDWDPNGNMLDRNDGTYKWNYTYDPMNRLKAVTREGSPFAEYYYDAGGRRVQSGGSVDGTVDYVYSGLNIIDEISGGTHEKHTYAGGMHIASSTSGTVEYYHVDHLGSTRLKTNSTGEKVYSSNYEPFGPGVGEPGSEDYRYTGKHEDPSGLYYFGARYYDPITGRFTTRDTYVGTRFDPQSLNRYSYCYNNPMKYNDPTGHMGMPPIPMDPWAIWQGLSIIGGYIGSATNDIVQTLYGGLSPDTSTTSNSLTGGYYVDPELEDYVDHINRSGLTSQSEQNDNDDSNQDRDPRLKLREGKQGLHQPGHKNYLPGRSPLMDDFDPQKGLDDKGLTGDPANNAPFGEPGYRERVDFGRPIGYIWDKINQMWWITTKGIIHYSKKGAHIVPANP